MLVISINEKKTLKKKTFKNNYFKKIENNHFYNVVKQYL